MQRKSASANDPGAVSAASPLINEALNSEGHSLDPITRGFLEPRFGHDFSQVRVHSDARAAEAASAIGARAYTVSRDIVFGANEYAPQTDSGCRLLAHELTHVVQQRAGVQLSSGVGQAGDAYERQADAVANQVVNGRSAEGILESAARGSWAGPVRRKAATAIQLQSDPSKKTSPKTVNQQGSKNEPSTLPEVTITAERPKNADEIIKMLGPLREQLLTAKSITRQKLLVNMIKALLIDLESAPISPTPKRDFVAGPIKFSDSADYYYEFGFKSMQDMHWQEGWTAIYNLLPAFLPSPFGIALSLCEFFLAQADEQKDLGKDIIKDEAIDDVTKKGKDVGAYMIRKGVPKGLAKGVAISLKEIDKGLAVAITAYDLYKANTEGPSPHAAAVETTALIMARVYGTGYDPDGTIRKFGFIPGSTSTYLRVARQQIGPFPQIEDRKLAFELMANRVYERMRNIIAPKHIESPEAFYIFRNAQADNAWNIVDAAGGDLMGRKTTLIRGKEEELNKMEEWEEWQKTQPKIDATQPIKFSPETMRSDQLSGVERMIKQRHPELRQ